MSLAERLAHDLHPLTAFVVVPLFALANAGVTVDRDALAGVDGAGAVLGGILLGRVVGKLAGIGVAVWLAVRLGLAAMPGGASWRQVAGVATVAGIGFTVPLFVAGLAFPPGRFDAAVKLGLLLASVLPAPAARWSCWRVGANGVLDALDDFCAFPYPAPLVEAGGVRAPTTRPPGQRP